MAGILKTWKKNQTALYVNILQDNANPQDWARIGKSTIFDLNLNANTESYDFIDQENPTEVLKNYAPTISEELRTIRGEKAFDALWEYLYNLPTGEEAVRDALFVFPSIQALGTTSTDNTFHAWLVQTSLVMTNFNTPDEKILFNINFAGDIVRGTVKAVSGQPVFTPSADQTVWHNTTDDVAP